MYATLVVLSMSLTGVNGPNASPQELGLQLHPIEKKLVEKTNAERVRYGLKPLKVEPRLIRSARRHAIWMTRNQSLTHTSDAVAENIAWGQRNSSEAIRSWMNSPGHRANMLNSSYTRIGVAAYVSANGSIYWCQQFLE